MRRQVDLAAGPDLDLVPLLNIVVCLVPLVLLGTTLIKVGIIETEAPRFCQGCSINPSDSPPLGLKIHLGQSGMVVAAQGEDRLRDTPVQLATEDFAGLYRLLDEAKARHPDETLVQLSADPGMPYRALVRVMDVTRNRLSGSVTDAADLASADRLLDDRGRPLLLFPDVVFATAP